MTDLTAKIAALPEWPDINDYASKFVLPSGVSVTYSYPDADVKFVSVQLDAALARLALAREWIEEAHLSYCDINMRSNGRCDCGRDALLAALEEPKA